MDVQLVSFFREVRRSGSFHTVCKNSTASDFEGCIKDVRIMLMAGRPPTRWAAAVGRTTCHIRAPLHSAAHQNLRPTTACRPLTSPLWAMPLGEPQGLTCVHMWCAVIELKVALMINDPAKSDQPQIPKRGATPTPKAELGRAPPYKPQGDETHSPRDQGFPTPKTSDHKRRELRDAASPESK
jgi:hypothetical protein